MCKCLQEGLKCFLNAMKICKASQKQHDSVVCVSSPDGETRDICQAIIDEVFIAMQDDEPDQFVSPGC